MLLASHIVDQECVASLSGPDPLAELPQLHPIPTDVRWAEDYLAGASKQVLTLSCLDLALREHLNRASPLEVQYPGKSDLALFTCRCPSAGGGSCLGSGRV